MSATLMAGALPAVLAGLVWAGTRLARPPARAVTATISDRAPSRRSPQRRPLLGRRLLAGGAASVTAVTAGLVPSFGVLVVLAFLMPRWRVLRRRRAAARAVIADLPDTIDVLVALVRAGLTPPLAVEMLVQRAPPSWQPGFAAVAAARHQGIRLVDALDELVTVLGAPAQGIVGTLSSAERYGHPLGPALERLADEGRATRRRLAEVEARQLPVRLSFPLVCCTLPSFVLLTIAPLLAGAFSNLTHSGGRP